MHWPAGSSRLRGLHPPSPSKPAASNFVSKIRFPTNSPASMTVDRSCSNSSTGSDSDDTIIICGEGKEGTFGNSIGNYGEKKVRYSSTPSLPFNGASCTQSTGKRNWTLWSVWSEALNELLKEVRGLRIQIEKATFINVIIAIFRDLGEVFPVKLFSEDYNLFILKKSDFNNGNCYDATEFDFGQDEILIEVTPISFNLPEKSAESKSSASSSIFIACVDNLAEILANVLQGNELLLIHGGVFLTDNNSTRDVGIRILDLNHVNTCRVPVHIVRLNPTPISGNKKQTDKLCLLEVINDKPNVDDHFFFKYAASTEGQSKKIERHRKFRTRATPAPPRGPLEEFLFPISKHTQASAAFDAIINYAQKNDPAWHGFKRAKSFRYVDSTSKKSDAEAFCRDYIPPRIRFYDNLSKHPATSSFASPSVTFFKLTSLKSAKDKQSQGVWLPLTETKKLKNKTVVGRYYFLIYFIMYLVIVFTTCVVVHFR